MAERPQPPLERLVDLGRAVRAEGVAVGPDRVAALVEAASQPAAVDLYWAGRATLIARHEDIPAYDRAFARTFAAGRSGAAFDPPTLPPVAATAAGAPQPAGDVAGEPGPALASAVEMLRARPFDRLTPEELDRLAAATGEVELYLPRRRTRRAAPARSGAPDLRRTLRQALRTGGDSLEPFFRRRRRRRRRLVLLLDVSGSMEAYARALVVLAYALLRRDATWEAFCFGTRLTRLTPALAAHDPQAALTAAAARATDWGGGTRIGDSLAAFVDRHGQGRLCRGAVVVICSDGLDVGDPAVLAAQMERLSLVAYRVVWLNPLKSHPEFRPLARGMQAALPYVDLFASGHSVDSVADVGRALGRL
jgi:uncharacterized protein with von Willebrand factor type A (vWA) domain